MESDADLSPAVPTDPPDAYPHELCDRLEFDDGARVDIRPIVPGDIARIRHAFLAGDPDSIRRRFLTGAPPSDELPSALSRRGRLSVQACIARPGLRR